ncbi:MAG: flavin reductase family protein, partial [Nitrososphaerales archaeon]
MEIGKDAFRQVLGTYATGVSIVMTKSRGAIHGLTVNSFTSVSLDPPLVLVCIDRNTETYPLLKESNVFSVNILSKDQEPLSRLFSDPHSKSSRLRNLQYRQEVTGAPIIIGSLSFLD